MTMKKDPSETISRYNHKFHIVYKRMESPFIVALPIEIQTYLDSMDYFMMIFLWQLPLANIDTLEKLFQEVVTFTKQANPNGVGTMIIPLPIGIANVLPPYEATL